MKKITKLLFFLCAFLALNGSYGSVQIIPLSTGNVNMGGVDVNWQVMPPGASTFQNCYLDNDIRYPTPPDQCAKWIGPSTASPLSVYVTGNPVWKMNFNTSGCEIISARIVFSYTNADDALLDFNVNSGFTYNYGSPTPGLTTAFIPGSSYIVNIPPSTFVNGTNQLTFDAFNYSATYDPSTYTPIALALCAQLEITYNDVLTPVFTTSSNICSGSQIIVNGSATNNSTITAHVWTVVQCDQYGNNLPSNPPTWWSPWFPGSPGFYTIPNAANGGPNITCGNYYRVGLAVQNPCNNWAPTSQVIYVTCPPAISLGPNQTFCDPNCVSLSPTGGPRGMNYNWVIMGDEPYSIGSGSYMVVCPTTTTTYCATTATGCPATACITINVEQNKPDFTLTATPTDPTYQTFSATPMQTTGLPPGFGFMWIIDELDALGNVVHTINSSTVGACWWTFPGSEVFDGFDGLSYPYTLSGSPACSPSLGKFKYNTNYRITRGVWSTNCPWKQFSYKLTAQKPGRSMQETEIIVDSNAPERSYLLNSINQTPKESGEINCLTVYPNPSNGLVSFNYSIDKNTSGKISVTDILGRTLQTIIISSSNNTESIDMSANKDGIYFVNLFSGDKLIKTQKIILSH